MKVLVCGGRLFQNQAAVFGVLDMVHKADGIDCIVHGGAPGADTLAGEWAKAHGIQVKVYEISREEWILLGPSAGPRRNARMLADESPEFVVAFEGGKGTADMVRRAKKADVTVLEVSFS